MEISKRENIICQSIRSWTEKAIAVEKIEALSGINVLSKWILPLPVPASQSEQLGYYFEYWRKGASDECPSYVQFLSVFIYVVFVYNENIIH